MYARAAPSRSHHAPAPSCRAIHPTYIVLTPTSPRLPPSCRAGGGEGQEEEDLPVYVNTSTLTWPAYLAHYSCLTGTKALAVVDGAGEWLADFFGITGPKYWYIIEEYERQKAEEERERREGLYFDEQRLEGGAAEETET